MGEPAPPRSSLTNPFQDERGGACVPVGKAQEETAAPTEDTPQALYPRVLGASGKERADLDHREGEDIDIHDLNIHAEPVLGAEEHAAV